jgi:hypothetical protein
VANVVIVFTISFVLYSEFLLRPCTSQQWYAYHNLMNYAVGYAAARLLHSAAATPNALGRVRLDVAAKCSFSGSNIHSFGIGVVKNGITVRLFDFGLPHIYVAFIKCTYVYDLPPYIVSLA